MIKSTNAIKSENAIFNIGDMVAIKTKSKENGCTVVSYDGNDHKGFRNGSWISGKLCGIFGDTAIVDDSERFNTMLYEIPINDIEIINGCE